MQDRSLGNEFTNLYRRIQTLEELIQVIRSQLATTHSGNRLVGNTIVGVIPPGGGGTGYTVGSGPTIQPFINNTGGALADGDVVVIDPTGIRLINTTTTPGDVLTIGVVRDVNAAGPFADQAETPVMLLGSNATVNVTGAVAAGDYLQASASAGEAESAGATASAGSFAVAETAFAGPGSGTVAAFIYGIDNTGGVSLPPGGTTGQALLKDSGTDGDASWHDIEDEATSETNTARVLAPDGLGGVAFVPISAAGGVTNVRTYLSFGVNERGQMHPLMLATPGIFAVQIPLKRTATETFGTINVNNASYASLAAMCFNVDLDYYPFSHFRVVVSGNSNAAAQTITALLATFGAPSTAIHSGDAGLVITNTPGVFDSGWLSRDDGATGLKEYQLSLKGSNGTVDLLFNYVEIHLRLNSN